MKGNSVGIWPKSKSGEALNGNGKDVAILIETEHLLFARLPVTLQVLNRGCGFAVEHPVGFFGPTSVALRLLRA